MASSNSTLANCEPSSTSGKTDSVVENARKEEQDLPASNPADEKTPTPAETENNDDRPIADLEETAPATNDSIEQSEVVYPTGLKQGLIVLGVLLGTFPVSLDFVGIPKPVYEVSD